MKTNLVSILQRRGAFPIACCLFTGFALTISGCDNAGQGALSGAAVGALGGLAIGSLSGNAGAGAAIGAVSGAVVGGVIGDQNRRAQESQQNMRYGGSSQW
ncbi:MAG: glycine zipper domain-containing protein [Phycisphaerales bacterium]